MLFKPRLPRRSRVYQRHALTIAIALFILDALFLIATRPYTNRDPTPHAAAPADVSVFIVSVHRNTEEILRAAWNDAVVDLVSRLGAQNVHFSAVEGGSQDKTKAALMQLKGRLDAAGVSNTITLGMTVWEQVDEIETRPDPRGEREPGWIWNKEDGHYDMRRIPYLARVRNQAMEPLKALEKAGRKFDKVLWLNDVVFDTDDFLALVNTRNGHYAAACSMDFKDYPYYYDTFALRDDTGQKTTSYYWPWFSSPRARASARRGDPVEVFSCWNGIVVFDSAPFYADPPLRFRGVDDSLADLHLEGSECCLVHADNPLSRGGSTGGGVWLNPNVRVGYNVPAYRQVRAVRFPGPVATVAGAWVNRAARLWVGMQFSLESRTVRARVERWKAETPPGELSRTEPGEPCLINEMQIMWQNGWKHL